MSSQSSVKSGEDTCQLCRYQTLQILHEQAIHGGKLQCTECEFKAVRTESLHLGRKLQCPECEHPFTFIKARTSEGFAYWPKMLMY